MYTSHEAYIRSTIGPADVDKNETPNLPRKKFRNTPKTSPKTIPQRLMQWIKTQLDPPRFAWPLYVAARQPSGTGFRTSNLARTKTHKHSAMGSKRFLTYSFNRRALPMRSKGPTRQSTYDSRGCSCFDFGGIPFLSLFRNTHITPPEK